MFRHHLIAALRNMAANRLQSAIAILGLAVGITAAILMGLVVRNQTSFDHFISGYERTYTGVWSNTLPGRAPGYSARTDPRVAALLKLNAAGIENAARLMLAGQGPVLDKSVNMKRGETAARETIYWADPNVFDVLPLPVYRGDLKMALMRPDGIVLSRAVARKYFGHDDVVGQTVMINNHPMVVRAVIEDLPANQTELQSDIFASGLASFSGLATAKSFPGFISNSVYTYIRLKPEASVADVQSNAPVVVSSIAPWAKATSGSLILVPLDRINRFEGLCPGANARLAVAGLVGLLILFIASVNFVNLLTARAARRALEVGVRKVSGASRRLLVMQFLGEAIVTVFFSTCIAIVLSEWLMRSVNAFLVSGAVFDYWRNPGLLTVLVLGILVLGVSAGAYPAFVLSAFRPAAVLKSSVNQGASAGAVRTALVILQFSILIVLVVAASVVYQQRVFATQQGLRADIDQMLVVHGECRPAFRAEVRKLPGVAGVSCTDGQFLTNGSTIGIQDKGEHIAMDMVNVDWGVFALYGIKPVAGSLTTLSPYGDFDTSAPTGVILNQSAVRLLGFVSPQAAVGQLMPKFSQTANRIRIAAVVPDFAFYSVERPLEPTMYVPGPLTTPDSLVNVKLKDQQIPETLAAIDRLWTETGGTGPIRRSFLDQQMQELYLDMTREAEAFAIFSGVAVFLACLGLFGLSISATERRTKEIGVRKAMGAENGNIILLLLWQFSKPVLWANLIAWPLAWWAMSRWLNGFAYHVPLNWWLFPAAGAVALLVAMITVAGQTWLVARQKPVLALRYE